MNSPDCVYTSTTSPSSIWGLSERTEAMAPENIHGWRRSSDSSFPRRRNICVVIAAGIWVYMASADDVLPLGVASSFSYMAMQTHASVAAYICCCGVRAAASQLLSR